MFKRKKRFKPYRMNPIRVKSWREIAWTRVMLLAAGAYGILFALLHELQELQELWDEIELVFFTQDDSRPYHGRFEHKRRLFGNDDDSVAQGRWDITSSYYTLFHSD